MIVHPIYPLILFPTKPLNEKAPHLSWQGPADLWLIEGSLMELSELPESGTIALPLVGCGAGGLQEKQVLPLLRHYLRDDRFMLVRWR